MGIPAAMKPPKTRTRTSRLTGRARASPCFMSVCSWPTTADTSWRTRRCGPWRQGWRRGCPRPASRPYGWPRPGRCVESDVEGGRDEEAARGGRPVGEHRGRRRAPRAPGTTNGEVTEATGALVVTFVAKSFVAAATAGSSRLTPATVTRTDGPTRSESLSRSRPVTDSLATLGSPEPSRLNRDSLPKPPRAAVKATAERTTHRATVAWRDGRRAARADAGAWVGRGSRVLMSGATASTVSRRQRCSARRTSWSWRWPGYSPMAGQRRTVAASVALVAVAAAPTCGRPG